MGLQDFRGMQKPPNSDMNRVQVQTGTTYPILPAHIDCFGAYGVDRPANHRSNGHRVSPYQPTTV